MASLSLEFSTKSHTNPPLPPSSPPSTLLRGVQRRRGMIIKRACQGQKAAAFSLDPRIISSLSFIQLNFSSLLSPISSETTHLALEARGLPVSALMKTLLQKLTSSTFFSQQYQLRRLPRNGQLKEWEIKMRLSHIDHSGYLINDHEIKQLRVALYLAILINIYFGLKLTAIYALRSQISKFSGAGWAHLKKKIIKIVCSSWS